eukprot:1148080-Pelagomonas_calceolata.AAC.7
MPVKQPAESAHLRRLGRSVGGGMGCRSRKDVGRGELRAHGWIQIGGHLQQPLPDAYVPTGITGAIEHLGL